MIIIISIINKMSVCTVTMIVETAILNSSKIFDQM